MQNDSRRICYGSHRRIRLKVALFWAAAFLSFLVLSTAIAATSQSDKELFDPSSIHEITWKYKNESLKLKRGIGGDWIRVAAPKTLALKNTDSWAIHRRLVLLAKSDGIGPVPVTNPLGSLTFRAGPQSYNAFYDDNGVSWKGGPFDGRGFVFANHPELKSLFDEGYLGLMSHEIKACDADAITKVTWDGKNTLVKNKNKWTTEDASTARPKAVENFVDHLCHFTADSFEMEGGEKTGENAAVFTSGKKTYEVRVTDGVFDFTGLPRFKSKELSAVLSQKSEDLKDFSTAEGRIALDTTKTSKERIEALRKIKELRSPEAIPALKEIVNEQTEIDLYRYEAVDALAAIGTKEAYKIIADRLALVGRSGYELRLARALSMAMGRTFMSDEKTPESRRRTEVQDLLEAYRKNPPGQ